MPWRPSRYSHGSCHTTTDRSVRRCRLGKSIVYDTVSNLSWAVDIRTHGIVSVIDNILSDPWPASMEVGREVPLAAPDVDCVVRFSTLWTSRC